MDLEVAGFFQHLLALKRAGEPVDNLTGFIEAGALQILALKQAHRELCERTEALREATSEAKTQLDHSSLQLQNLLYEQQHYEKEIAGCRAYTSAYTGGGGAGGVRLLPAAPAAGATSLQRPYGHARTAAAGLLNHFCC